MQRFLRRIVKVVLVVSVLIGLTLTPRLAPLVPVFAADLPSMFRGVVVADSSFGVRVVSVEETSQASQADLRPEDIIIRVDSDEVDSIDTFAELSMALKGNKVRVNLLIFRNGMPKELDLNLFSYPVMRAWNLEFVQDHDLRFAKAHIAEEYWMRMARGYLEAGNEAQALNSYLNTLHNQPDNITAAVKVAELFSRIGHKRLTERVYIAGIASLHQSLIVMDRLFDTSLNERQLNSIKEQLKKTILILRELNSKAVE